jgi:hypothetical protein
MRLRADISKPHASARAARWAANCNARRAFQETLIRSLSASDASRGL